MAMCPNCKASIGCACKLRTASDGTRCCTRCLSGYEANKKKKATALTNLNLSPSGILSVTASLSEITKM